MKKILHWLKKIYFVNIFSILFDITMFVLYLLEGIRLRDENNIVAGSFLFIAFTYLFFAFIAITYTLFLAFAKKRKVRFTNEIRILRSIGIIAILIIGIIAYTGPVFIYNENEHLSLLLIIFQISFAVFRIVYSIIDGYRRTKRTELVSLSYATLRQLFAIYSLYFAAILLTYIIPFKEVLNASLLIAIAALAEIVLIYIAVMTFIRAHKYKNILRRNDI